MKTDRFVITTLANTVYKKCECCNRVRDIFFKMDVKDAPSGQMLVGDFDLCKSCGENFGDILNIQTKTETTVTEFKF